MPGDQYTTLTLGPSGSSYVAPADGYLYLSKNATSGQYVKIFLKNSAGTLLICQQFNSTYNSFIAMYLPITKGQIVQIFYDTNLSVNEFWFLYSVGSQPA